MIDFHRHLLSGCSTPGCWKNQRRRDDELDIVVAIVSIFLLLVGVLISYLSSGGCQPPAVVPHEKEKLSSYDRATIIFLRLFQRPPKFAGSNGMTKSTKNNDADNSDNWQAPPTQTIVAEQLRSKRQLVDNSLIMDLSDETNILYSGNTLNTHIIAQKAHLEYDFGSSSELETIAKQFMQMKASFLPTIFERTSSFTSNSHSNIDSFASLPQILQDDRHRRQQFRREIVLFSGPEEKRQFLQDDDNVDDDDDNFQNYRHRAKSSYKSHNNHHTTNHYNHKSHNSSKDFLWAFEDDDSGEEYDNDNGSDHRNR